MVFEPTFEEIGREADRLPDLSGEDADVDDDELLDDEVPEDELPPQGA